MTENNNSVFSGDEIIELCDSIKDIHRVLKSVGDFYAELEKAEVVGGNGLNIDFKKWGIRTITEDLLGRQTEKIDRISEIYRDEGRRIMGKDDC